jgi:DNA-directed RNA polymerase specialized sigma24 family protein
MVKNYMLYSRYEDGSKPIQIKEEGEGRRKRYELEVGGKIFTSLSSFLKTSKSKAATSFYTYFGVRKISDLPIFSIFRDIEEYRNEQLAEFENEASSIEEVKGGDVKTGFNIADKKKDIERIFYAFYAKRAVAEGLSVEDLLQQVFIGLISRNTKRGAWNPARGSFGSYIHLVIGSVYRNFRKKEISRGMKERLEVPKNYTESTTSDSDFLDDKILLDSFKNWIKTKKGMGDLAGDVTVLLSEGRKKKEIAEQLGINSTHLHKLIVNLKSKVSEFLNVREIAGQ